MSVLIQLPQFNEETYDARKMREFVRDIEEYVRKVNAVLDALEARVKVLEGP